MARGERVSLERDQRCRCTFPRGSGVISRGLVGGACLQTVANSDARFADNASVKQNEIEHVLAFPVSSDADRVVVYLQRRGPFDTTDRARAEFLGMQLGLVISKLVNEQIDSSADERATRRRNVLAALDHRSWNVTEAAQSGWMFRSHRWPTGK